MKTIDFRGSELNPANKKEGRDQFGTWFKGEGTPDYFITKCEEMIANCKKWQDNLEELKRLKLVEKATEHKEELKALLASMTPEERTAFIS